MGAAATEPPIAAAAVCFNAAPSPHKTNSSPLVSASVPPLPFPLANRSSMSFSLAYKQTTAEEAVLDTLRLCFGKLRLPLRSATVF